MTLTPQYVYQSACDSRVKIYGQRVLYVDGSYGQGVSGWAVVEDGACIVQDWCRGLTSNLAEGMAVLRAVEELNGQRGLIVTDSRVWMEVIMEQRMIKGKESREVTKQIGEAWNPKSEILWVPSHSGIFGNELADMYAKDARINMVSVPSSEDLALVL